MKKMLQFNKAGFDSFVVASYEALVKYFIHVKKYEADAVYDMVNDFYEWGARRDWEGWSDGLLARGKQPKFDLIDAKLKISSQYRDEQESVAKSAGMVSWSAVEAVENYEDTGELDGFNELAELFECIGLDTRDADLILENIKDKRTPEKILVWREWYLENEKRIPERIAKLSPQQKEIMEALEAKMKPNQVAEAMGLVNFTIYTQIDRACEKIYKDEPHLRGVYPEWKDPHPEEMRANLYIWNGLWRTVHELPVTSGSWTEAIDDMRFAIQAWFEYLAYGLERTNAAAKYYRSVLNEQGISIALSSDRFNYYTPRQGDLSSIFDADDEYDWAGATRLFNCLGLGKVISENTLEIIKRLAYK